MMETQLKTQNSRKAKLFQLTGYVCKVLPPQAVENKFGETYRKQHILIRLPNGKFDLHFGVQIFKEYVDTVAVGDTITCTIGNDVIEGQGRLINNINAFSILIHTKR